MAMKVSDLYLVERISPRGDIQWLRRKLSVAERMPWTDRLQHACVWESETLATTASVNSDERVVSLLEVLSR